MTPEVPPGTRWDSRSAQQEEEGVDRWRRLLLAEGGWGSWDLKKPVLSLPREKSRLGTSSLIE